MKIESMIGYEIWGKLQELKSPETPKEECNKIGRKVFIGLDDIEALLNDHSITCFEDLKDLLILLKSNCKINSETLHYK